MTIQEIEQKLCEMERELKNTVNAIEENIGNEIDDLRGALAELKEGKKVGKWKPKHGERYFYRDTCGDIAACTTTVQDDWDIWRINNLPVFPTKEVCARYWHFMDTVKEKSYEFSKEEWADETVEKWFVNYEYCSKRFYPDNFLGTKILGTIYFATREDAQYIIDNFKDELMEYFI